MVDENENPCKGFGCHSRQAKESPRLRLFPDLGSTRKGLRTDIQLPAGELEQRNFPAGEGEEETITPTAGTVLDTLQVVCLRDQRDRNDAGLIRLNPKTILNLPALFAG